MTERLVELDADVVVLDAQQSAVEALATLQCLRAVAPLARILVFSSPESIEFGVLCLCTGASGYLSKDIDLGALTRIVRGLGRGETIVSRALATELIARMRAAQPRSTHHPRPALSASERRLLEMLRTGRSIAAAAANSALRNRPHSATSGALAASCFPAVAAAPAPAAEANTTAHQRTNDRFTPAHRNHLVADRHDGRLLARARRRRVSLGLRRRGTPRSRRSPRPRRRRAARSRSPASTSASSSPPRSC